jgi:urease accessory protein UreE
VFRSLPVARTRCRADNLPAAAVAYPQDAVTVGWEERLKTRARRRSDSGFEFATALPRGTILVAGDLLVLDDVQRVIEVRELEEDVLVIRPASPQQWALFAYHIGNSHQPVMIADDGIVCAELLGMKQVLEFHGIPFERERRPFTPVGLIPDHQHAVRA